MVAISSSAREFKTLEEISESIDYGLTASAEATPTDYRFLRITDIVGNLDWKTVPYVTVDEADQKKYKLHDGDIVVARTGATTGASCYIKGPPDAVFASYLVRYKIKRGCDSRYVSYYLKSSEWWSYITGVLGDKSAQPNASASTMAQARLPIPPLPEQRAIAAILGALDDKIELNRRMNATLEATARALFKSWFVDFDPVRARMEGRQPFGMDAATANLFPNCFEDSEIGEIPKGWQTSEINRLASLNSEAWSNKEHPDSIEYVDLANTKWGTIESLHSFAWEDAPSRAQRVIRTGDTIVGTVRPGNGSYAYVHQDGMTASTGFAALRPKESIFREFVYLAVTQRENILIRP